MKVSSLKDCLQQFQTLSPDAFLATFQHPVLVRHGPPGERQDSKTFHTEVAKSLEDLVDAEDQTSAPEVISIEKQQAVFETMITCGRAKNNDIVIQEVGLSRFHAWFSYRASDKRWCVADATSSNGTFVNGNRLEPDKPQPLNDGDRIGFSPQVLFRFFSPRGFREMLRGMS